MCLEIPSEISPRSNSNLRQRARSCERRSSLDLERFEVDWGPSARDMIHSVVCCVWYGIRGAAVSYGVPGHVNDEQARGASVLLTAVRKTSYVLYQRYSRQMSTSPCLIPLTGIDAFSSEAHGVRELTALCGMLAHL